MLVDLPPNSHIEAIPYNDFRTFGSLEAAFTQYLAQTGAFEQAGIVDATEAPLNHAQDIVAELYSLAEGKNASVISQLPEVLRRLNDDQKILLVIQVLNEEGTPINLIVNLDRSSAERVQEEIINQLEDDGVTLNAIGMDGTIPFSPDQVSAYLVQAVSGNSASAFGLKVTPALDVALDGRIEDIRMQVADNVDASGAQTPEVLLFETPCTFRPYDNEGRGSLTFQNNFLFFFNPDGDFIRLEIPTPMPLDQGQWRRKLSGFTLPTEISASCKVIDTKDGPFLSVTLQVQTGQTRETPTFTEVNFAFWLTAENIVPEQG